MRKIFILLLAIVCLMFAQDIGDIKNSHNYIWGKGTAGTLRKADRLAIDDLISQISVQVESKFRDMITEKDGDVKEYTESVLTTYSNTSLNNAQRIVEEGRNKTTVYRYMLKDDLDKVFADRQIKIINYTDLALKAEEELRIGDALRYYYWSLVLLRSHPDHNAITMTFPGEGNQLLITALPDRIDRIFTFLHISPLGIRECPHMGQKIVSLQFDYKGQPVQNLDFHFWDGTNWTKKNGINDGRYVSSKIGQLST